MPSGEILLGNGKLIGHRQFHYIYKQRPRLPDDREATVISKLALEQRKIRALTNGGVGDSLIKESEIASFKSRVQFEKHYQQKQLKHGMMNSKN